MRFYYDSLILSHAGCWINTCFVHILAKLLRIAPDRCENKFPKLCSPLTNLFHVTNCSNTGTMVYKKFIEIGGVVFISSGPNSGKLAAVVNVIDQNRLLVDGPCNSVPRCVVNMKNIQLTKFQIKIPYGARTGTVKKAWEKSNVNESWSETLWAKKIASKARKATLTDFDRFRLMKLKQKRSRIIAAELSKLKKQAKSA